MFKLTINIIDFNIIEFILSTVNPNMDGVKYTV